MVADYDGRTGEVRALYLTPFLDENLLKEDYTGPGPILAWYTQDGLGSVRQLVVGDTVQNGYAYTSWGVPLNWSESVSNRYTYTSREHNPETHLYHYRARTYFPHTGRFLQSDPASVVWWSYLYAYAANSPLTIVDPLGKWTSGYHKKFTKQVFKDIMGTKTLKCLIDASVAPDEGDLYYKMCAHGMRIDMVPKKNAFIGFLYYVHQMLFRIYYYIDRCLNRVRVGRRGAIWGRTAVWLVGILLHAVQDFVVHQLMTMEEHGFHPWYLYVTPFGPALLYAWGRKAYWIDHGRGKPEFYKKQARRLTRAILTRLKSRYNMSPSCRCCFWEVYDRFEVRRVFVRIDKRRAVRIATKIAGEKDAFSKAIPMSTKCLYRRFRRRIARELRVSPDKLQDFRFLLQYLRLIG